MEPIKSLISLAKWLLRLALAAFIYHNYFDIAVKFSFDSLLYFVSLSMVVFGILLLIGGFIKKNNLTVLSSLIILILSLVLLFNGGVSADELFRYMTPLALSVFFLAQGNR